MAKIKDSNSLEALMKKYKAGTLQRVHKFRNERPVLSTGIFPLDLALGAVDPELGTPGATMGDILEICGENNSYKTGTWEHCAKATLERFGPQSVVGVFSEPPNVDRLVSLGVNPEDIISIDCYNEEGDSKLVHAKAALEALLEFARMPQIKLCVVDSVATLTPETDMDRGLGESAVAGLAKIMNSFTADFTKIEGDRPLLMLINFYREPVVTGFKAVPPSALRPNTPGGRGMEFLSNYRIQCTSFPLYSEKNHSVLDTKIHQGLKIKYKVFKNKESHTTGTRTVAVEFDFKTKMINNAESILTYATFFTRRGESGKQESLLDPPVIQAGAWYMIGEEKFQGSTKAAEWLNKQPELMKKLKAQITKRQDMFFEDDSNFTSEYILDHME